MEGQGVKAETQQICRVDISCHVRADVKKIEIVAMYISLKNHTTSVVGGLCFYCLIRFKTG